MFILLIKNELEKMTLSEIFYLFIDSLHERELMMKGLMPSKH